MKKYQFLYPAIFIKDSDGECQVFFPDLNIYTTGKNISEAYLYAKDLLKVFFTYALKYEVEYNKPSKIEKLTSISIAGIYAVNERLSCKRLAESVYT